MPGPDRRSSKKIVPRGLLQTVRVVALAPVNALDMAEQFAFQHARPGRAVDGQTAPGPGLGGGSRRPALARAAFAFDQHGGVGVGHFLDQLKDLWHRPLADEVVAGAPGRSSLRACNSSRRGADDAPRPALDRGRTLVRKEDFFASAASAGLISRRGRADYPRSPRGSRPPRGKTTRPAGWRNRPPGRRTSRLRESRRPPD